MDNKKNLLPWIVLILVAFGGFTQGIIRFITDFFWYQEIGYVLTFLVRLKTYLILGVPVFLVAFIIFYIYLRALRKRYEEVAETKFHPETLKKIKQSMILGSAGIALVFTIMAVGNVWFDWLGFTHGTAFGKNDPIFNKDISFYFFTLPLLKQMMGQGLGILLILGAFTLGFMLLLANIRPVVHDHVYDLNEFRGRKDIRAIFNRNIFGSAILKIGILGSISLLLISLLYVISVYSLVYSHQGVTYGASFTDIHVTLPGYWLKAAAALVGALFCLYGGIKRQWKPMAIGPMLLITLAVITGVVEFGIQRFVVEPDERSKEKPYIARTIENTRAAYNLGAIQEIEFPAQDDLTREDLDKNTDIIDNIRINDTHPLKQTVNQLQAIRLYYEFNDVDIDRYMIDGKYRQVFIAAREMNQEKLQAQTWVNKHLQFTHGYGVALAPVNEVTPEGQPMLKIKNVPPVSNSKDLTIKRPEIYFGEFTNNYIVVDTKEKEFDYPKGSDNVYVRYQGGAGIPLNLGSRLLFALREHEISLLLSNALTADSRIVINRNVLNRVQQIMPYISYDSNPYLVINQKDGKLYWIIDGYTASDRYPYSQPDQNGINYIRNSVKVVIDAYNGKTDFYIYDDKDPVIRTYAKIFTDLFKPKSAMPEGLKDHVQYPKELLKVQGEMYKTYHVTNPDVFYNSEDVWDLAQEKYMDSPQVKVEPNYVMFRLPDSKKLEFLLNIPFTPKDKSNMNALLMARNDEPHYGKLFVYRFPKDRLVQGPQMLESRFDQDTEISRQLSLWDQKGSSVLRGNLMTIPIKDSLLYVEPIYLRSQGERSLPEMKRVIVSYGDRVVMEETLGKALNTIFGQGQTKAPQGTVQTPGTQPVATDSRQVLINKAKQLMQESAQKMEELKKILEQLSSEGVTVTKP